MAVHRESFHEGTTPLVSAPKNGSFYFRVP